MKAWSDYVKLSIVRTMDGLWPNWGPEDVLHLLPEVYNNLEREGLVRFGLTFQLFEDMALEQYFNLIEKENA